MPIFEPYSETERETHAREDWTRLEAARYYVGLRREHASVAQVVDVRIRGPKCTSCMASDPFGANDPPTISHRTWREDIAVEVDGNELERIEETLTSGEDPAWHCIRCHGAIRPWDGDDAFVISKFLDEDYFLPLETGVKRRPARSMRRLVMKLYGEQCFGCGAKAPAIPLTIDHIVPRSKGGDAAFTNLQPLCESCQQRKGSRDAEPVGIYHNMFFGDVPSDGFEGIFW